MLHRLAEELETLQCDLHVLWPSPGTLFDLTVEELQGHLVGSLFGHVKDEHACEHLVENHSNGPHVNLVTVARPATPVSLNLLSRHHQGGPFKGESTVSSTAATA